MFRNEKIREEIKQAGLMYWQVAEKLNVNDGNFSRKLRKEFSEAEKDQVRNIIKELIKERE